MKYVHNFNYLYILITVIFITNLSIFFNIPVLRELFSFLYLAVLPGFLILKLFKIDNIDATETLVLSLGTSISFLMVYGLFINTLLFQLGMKQPLSTVPLLISFDIILLVFSAAIFKSGQNMNFSIPEISLNIHEKLIMALSFSLITLSLLGINQINLWSNSSLLMALMFGVLVTVILISVWNGKISKKLYPLILVLISISLLLTVALRSNNILGVDSHNEFYFFIHTLQNLHWSVGWSQLMESPLESCLSISLLPTIFQSFMNTDQVMLFKTLFIILYSISPLVIYLITRKYLDEIYAFLAAFFFMAQLNFWWAAANARTNIALLFFALVVMLILNDKIKPMQKSILIIAFIFSIVFSHYSTAILVLGMFIGTLIMSSIFSTFYSRQNLKLNLAITSTITALFIVFAFFWYSLMTGSAFESIASFITTKIVLFKSYFINESTEASISVVRGEGLGGKSIPSKIHFVFLWLVVLSIATGVLTLILKYKRMAFPEINSEKFSFMKQKFGSDFSFFTITNFFLLASVFVIPFLMSGYNLDRLFSTAMIVLSTSFVIGGIIISKLLRRVIKIKPYIIILIILIPYFLSTYAVSYQLMGDHRSVIYNSGGGEYNKLFIHDSEVNGIKWLINSRQNRTSIKTDFYSEKRFISQGNMIFVDAYTWLRTNNTKGYIYLRYQNIVKGEIIDSNSKIYPTGNFTSSTSQNKIYDGGYSQVLLGS